MAPQTPITPPTGWTTDNAVLNYDYYWASDRSEGQRLARQYGLPSPQPVMCNTAESGEFLYMFQSGGRYYIWNRTEGDVWAITEPKDLQQIVASINQSGVKALKLEQVEEVGAPEVSAPAA